MSRPTLYTTRYQNASGIAAANAVPVRTTRGAPLWRLPYEILGHISLIAPDKTEIKIDDEDRFTEAYWARLDDLGAVDTLPDIFALLSESNGGRPLALLCFEDLTKPGLFCHRRVFADGWYLRTGQEVPELGPTGLADDYAHTVIRLPRTGQMRLGL